MTRSLFEQEVGQLRPLRPKQLAAIVAVRQAIREGHTRIVLQAPTGFGKTLTAAHIIAAALRKGSKPLFTCPAITLVEQTLKSFEGEGLFDIGIMQAAHPRTDPHASLQIACVPTLIRRPAPNSDFALIDECHEEFDGLYAMLDSAQWKNRIVIGLSATPWAKGMGLRWSKLIIASTIKELIADGHATPAVIYGPSADIDRGSIKVTAGEFDENQSSEVMSNPTVVGNVIDEWKEKSTREKTFMFCVNRKHAQAQMEAFQDCGIPFGYIDGNTPMGKKDDEPGTRLHEFARLRNGEIAGISSVGCLIRGVDEDVRCIVDLQPTRSEMRHVQKWGRGVRNGPGKTQLIGLDHAGNNVDLGLFTDIFHDELDTHKKEDRGEAYKGDNKAAKPRKCAKCHQVVPPGKRRCPTCGELVPLDHKVKMIDGRLVEIGSNYSESLKERQSWYSGLISIQRKMGYKKEWADHRFREKYGCYPNGLRVVPRKSDAVLADNKKRNEEFKKAKAAAVKYDPVAETYMGEF